MLVIGKDICQSPVSPARLVRLVRLVMGSVVVLESSLSSHL